MKNRLIPTLILVMISVVATPTIIDQSHATNSPTVFVSPTSTPSAPPSTLMTFNVSVSNMPTFSGWDITLAVSNTSVLNPVSVNLIEAFGGTVVELSNCVNGVGMGCDERDGAGVAHSAAVSISGNGPYDSGNATLFTVTVNSTSGGGYAFLTLSSATVSTPSGMSLPITSSGATYGNAPKLPVAIFSWNPTMPYPYNVVTFNASLSYDPSGGTITSYRWIIDGYVQITTIPTALFDFSSTGNHTASLTVTNDKHVMSLPEVHTVLVIQPRGFDVSSTPNSIVIVKGSSDSFTITLTSLGGFAGTINLTVLVSPLGPVALLSKSSLFLASGEQTLLVLSVSIGHSVQTGNYAVTVWGSSGTLRSYTVVILSVTNQSTFHRHQ